VKPAFESREFKRLVLAGAGGQLPSKYCWFEGDGYWIYAAEQPPSTWHEQTNDRTQIGIGLEARAYLEWRTGSGSASRREVSGSGVAVIPAGEPHRMLWQRRAILVSIWLSRHFLSTIAGRVLRKTSFDLEPVYLMRDPLIEELGRALYREWEAHDLTAHFADSLVTVLATHLLRSYTRSVELPGLGVGLGPARTRRVRGYIEQSVGQDLSIRKLAKVAGLSPQYFAEMFRRTTGFAPHQYVSHRRVERARQLLADTDLPLAEVAQRCGFSSQSQFTTVFRQLTDLTPGRFRAEYVSPGKAVPAEKGKALPAEKKDSPWLASA
jgi:AraC family transcriptional regulator